MWAAVQCLLLLCVSVIHAEAFKQHDFKKCKDAAFCKRNRREVGGQFTVLPQSVHKTPHHVSATVQDNATSAEYRLVLSMYDGILRIEMDEATSSRRVRVSDVLSPDVVPPLSSSSWTRGETNVTLHYQPLEIVVDVGGQPAVTINSKRLLRLEHSREKHDGDPEGWWSESFKSHKDSKPKGPQAISLDLHFSGSSHVYGIPEHATSMSLAPTVVGNETVSEPYRLYNLDVFEYDTNSPFGLYGSVPLMLSHKVGLTVGAFWLNAAEMYVDVIREADGMQTHWIAESGVLDVFLLLGPTARDVSMQYAHLTGTSAMPQMFSVGYHQCRWNYKDEEDVARVNSGFDEHAMPCDVIWLDIEHTDGKRYMTWDSQHFPDPVSMQNSVADVGRKMVTIVDPHVKRDDSYSLHNEATKQRRYVRDATGKDFEGWCWPGSSSYLDVTNPAIRDWWASYFSLKKYQGSTPNLYIWNDMNEPSVFNGPEITMHKDALHHGDVEHRDVHNVYGMYYHMATADGLTRRGWEVNPEHGDRPFVLSRAFFAGTQRIGPVWTGDNAARWEHLRVSIPMLLTLSLAGISNTGADVGGFFGNPEPELLTRWYQAAIFYPFFRGHAHLETARREPWLFGEEATNIIRGALRERYALLPYLYTLFREANVTGVPIMRPMWYEFPDQEELFALDDQFMLGSAIMAAPVLEKGVSFVEVTMPKGERFFDAETAIELEHAPAGRTRIPVDQMSIPRYHRGGHIIARRERPRRSTAAQKNDPYTLVVALDRNQSAIGHFYADDGATFAFLNGAYLQAEVSLTGGKLHWNVQHAGKAYLHAIERIVIMGALSEPSLALHVESNRKLEIQRSPGTPKVVIRQPGVLISNNWTIHLS